MLMEDWISNPDRRARARLRALQSAEVCRQRAAHYGILARDRQGDSLGVAIAGGIPRVLALASQYCITPAEVVKKARSAAGALGAVANDVIATVLEVFRPDGSPDGLGCAIAGGLHKLEALTVAARKEAVRAARSAAGKAGNAACELCARVLGILDGAGNGDVLAFCAAGGLAKLEHLPLQKRLEAAEAARRKNSGAGNSKRQIERQVCNFNCVFNSN